MNKCFFCHSQSPTARSSLAYRADGNKHLVTNYCNNLHYFRGLPPTQAGQRNHWSYQADMPQPLGSLGGQLGTGTALVLEMIILLEAFAEEIWLEAAKPVRARTTTKARTMFFMMEYP